VKRLTAEHAGNAEIKLSILSELCALSGEKKEVNG
jgi:hypothetical protein